MKIAAIGLGIALAAAVSAEEAGKSGGIVQGKAVFRGEVPRNLKPAQIEMASDAVCSSAHGGKPVPSENAVLIDASGNLKNVFVYVKKGLEVKAFPTPAEPVRLVQKGCLYVPHVLGLRTGQALDIVNADPTLHNVHVLSRKNTDFNQSQPTGAQSIHKVFASPEVLIQVKCDIHSWMTAYIGVVDHPFFAVTGDDGAFSIPGLPLGTYEIEARHPRLGAAVQTVTVAADKPAAALEFAFDANGPVAQTAAAGESPAKPAEPTAAGSEEHPSAEDAHGHGSAVPSAGPALRVPPEPVAILVVGLVLGCLLACFKQHQKQEAARHA